MMENSPREIGAGGGQVVAEKRSAATRMKSARVAARKVSTFARWYGKLVLVTLFTAVVIGAGAPPITDLYHRITALEYQRIQNTEEFQESLSDRGETMDSLARIIESPKLLSPPPAAKISSSLTELRWKVSADSSGDYLVEIRSLAEDKTIRLEVATNPDDGIHHLPELPQGDYIWRVARRVIAYPSSKASEDLWSGYSRFTIPGKESEKELSIAINYAQQSRFMRRTSEGGYCGFDWSLISWIAKKLGRTPVAHEYATVPAMLDATANGLEDIAIGSITRTRSREQRGIAFTAGYLKSPPVLACTSEDPECPKTWSKAAAALDGDEVGVVQETTNDHLATELQGVLHFVRRPVGSVESLIRALKDHHLGWIIVDRPLINAACNSSAFHCFTIPAVLTPKYIAELGRQAGEEYAMASGNEAIRREVSQLLTGGKAQAFLDELSAKYLSSPPDKVMTDAECEAEPNNKRGGVR